MSTQQGLDNGKTKASPSWLQRMAANLGFASAPSLRETLESAIGETGAEEDTSLSPPERAMLLNVLGFGETRVAEVMIPRADIVAIEDTRPIAALFALFAKYGHSRVPVFHESLDNPLGMVHIKDAMAWATQNGAGKTGPRAAGSAEPIAALDFGSAKLNAPIAETGLVRDILFVPPSMPALTLLTKMKARKIHLAAVVDEFGGTDGLVTFGDLVEAIFGDIEDEHDTEAAPSIGYENEAFVASARTPIEVVEQVLGIPLPYEGAGDVDTLGGLIMAIAGSMPKRGQTVQHPSGVTFEILEAGPRRLHSIRILKQLSLGAPVAPLLLPAPQSGEAGKPDGRPATGIHGARAA
jgi:CBS domain containing-hemolysin-like protein